MNTQASLGYGSPGVAEAEPRRAEALILVKLAAGMIRASDPVNSSFAALVAALHENGRFWRAAAVDLAGDGNRLPAAVRAQLLSLAAFVEKETARVLAGTKGADALIEINRSVARGLFGQPAP